MNTEEFRRTGTIPVIEAFEVEHPLKKPFIISLLLTLLLFGGWMGWRYLNASDLPPNQKEYLELRETNPAGAIQFAIKELKLAKNKNEARFWREVLAEHNLKSGKLGNARVHYQWLVENFPDEPKYAEALKALAPAKKGSPTKTR